MNYYGNKYPLAWQLNKASEWISTYGAPNLVGFCFWLYEYMESRPDSPDDWAQWNYWINRVGTSTPPRLFTASIDSTPLTVEMSYDGAAVYTPFALYAFFGTKTLIVPTQVEGETHSVLVGDTDHKGEMGYSNYTYASGPYKLDTPTSVSQLYLYTPVAGNVKVAIYSAKKYSVSGWIPPNFTEYHPDQLLTQVGPIACKAGSWNLITIPAVTLSGVFFIAIKGDTSHMIGGSTTRAQNVEGAIYGYCQFITQSYDTPFSQTFPTIEGAMGENASVYIPTAPITLTPYYFSNWEDGSTNPVRTINLISDMTFTATYALVPPPEYTLDINTTTGGTTEPVPGSYTHPENTTVKITAKSDVNYNFDHWILDGIEYTTNPITIIMNSNHELTAYFSEIPPPPPETYNLTIVVTTGGTTEPIPGVYEATAGEIITVTAIPDEGYGFKRFELDGEVKIQNPINVCMDADHTLLAVFETAAPPISLALIFLTLLAASTGIGAVAVAKKGGG
jgi:hypothetical protein